jgi:hypothetical protein
MRGRAWRNVGSTPGRPLFSRPGLPLPVVIAVDTGVGPVTVIEDVLYSLRYLNDAHIARQLGEHQPH